MIRILSRLLRPYLALLNGVTAVGGYCLFPAPILSSTLMAAFCGVTLLTMGGSALNQLMERDIDVLMIRTMLRPLPQGHISTATAGFAGGSTILAGLILLSVSGGFFAPLFGATALVWYLAVYTPLKRKTTLALPLGALCGSFPPLIGWCLAGGTPTDYRIVILAGLLYIWQIPHFWLLQERHEADYRRAGFPLIEEESGPISRTMLFRLWLTAFIAGTMLLPALNIIVRPIAPWYAAFLVPLILLAFMHSRRLFFSCLNLFPVLVALIFLFNK
jgi:protoheme IX farnesyltransferase